MDVVVDWDKALFLWLNGLGSPAFDSFWMLITHRGSNVIIYLLLWSYISVKTSWKTGAYLLIFTALLILCTDQFTNFIKASTERLRPCYDEEIKSFVRLVKPTCGNRYGFFSGHASNSFALAIFFSSIVRSYSRWTPFVLFFFAALIAYSRVYIGVHFPLDILVGACVGSGIGYGFSKLWKRFTIRFLSKI